MMQCIIIAIITGTEYDKPDINYLLALIYYLYTSLNIFCLSFLSIFFYGVRVKAYHPPKTNVQDNYIILR